MKEYVRFVPNYCPICVKLVMRSLCVLQLNIYDFLENWLGKAVHSFWTYVIS